MGDMSSKVENLSALSPEKKQQLLKERIKFVFDLADQDATKYSAQLYSHYERLKIFPQSIGTLDVSIKALINMWKTKGENSPSQQL
jgi:hypothetical protein